MLRFDLIQPADAERVHALALRILAEVGVILHYPPARALLAAQRRRGRRGGRSVCASLPPSWRRRLRPRHAKYGCTGSDAWPRPPPVPRRPALRAHHHRAELDRGRWLSPCAGRSPRPTWSTGRASSMRCRNLHLAGSLNDQEEAVKSEEVRCLARMLHHTDKPFMFSAFSGEGMRWLWRLTEVVPSRRPPAAAHGALVGEQPAGLRLGPVRGAPWRPSSWASPSASTRRRWRARPRR